MLLANRLSAVIFKFVMICSIFTAEVPFNGQDIKVITLSYF
jgi:hypothetical protein